MFLLHMHSLSAKDSKYLRAVRLLTAIVSLTGSLCITVLIARTLGPAHFGQYQFAQWFALLAVPFIGIGTSTLSSRMLLSIPSNDTPRIAASIFHFLWRSQSYRSIIYLGLGVVSVVVLAHIPVLHLPLLPLLLALLSVPFILLQRVLEIALQSQRRIDLLTLLHLTRLSMLLLFMILMVLFMSVQPNMLLLAGAVSSALVLFIGLASLYRLLPLRKVHQPDPLFKAELRQLAHVSHWQTLCDEIVWQPSTLLLLQVLYWRTPAVLGFYMLSFLLSMSLMRFIPVFLLNAVFPSILRAIPALYFKNTYEAFIKTSWAIALCGLPLILLAFFGSPLLIIGMLGKSFLPLILPLRIQLLAAYCGSVATPAMTHLSTQRHWRGQTRLAAGSALLHVVLMVPGVLFWGVAGAAIASSVAQCVAAIGCLLICQHMLHLTTRRYAYAA